MNKRKIIIHRFVSYFHISTHTYACTYVHTFRHTVFIFKRLPTSNTCRWWFCCCFMCVYVLFINFCCYCACISFSIAIVDNDDNIFFPSYTYIHACIHPYMSHTKLKMIAVCVNVPMYEYWAVCVFRLDK